MLAALVPVVDMLVNRTGLPRPLIEGLVEQESGMNPKAVSKKGAKGLTQLMPATAKEMGLKKHEVFDPVKNLEAGIMYLSKLRDKYGGDMEKTLAAYNWGQGNVDRKGLENMPKETMKYLARLLPLVASLAPGAVASKGLPKTPEEPTWLDVLESTPGYQDPGFPSRESALRQNPRGMLDFGFGRREDGTKKGTGFLGALRRPDGRVSSELSIGTNFDGKEYLIPSLVPTLTKAEIDSLLKGGPISDEIFGKAVTHARERLGQGKSPLLEEGEQLGGLSALESTSDLLQPLVESTPFSSEKKGKYFLGNRPIFGEKVNPNVLEDKTQEGWASILGKAIIPYYQTLAEGKPVLSEQSLMRDAIPLGLMMSAPAPRGMQGIFARAMQRLQPASFAPNEIRRSLSDAMRVVYKKPTGGGRNTSGITSSGKRIWTDASKENSDVMNALWNKKEGIPGPTNINPTGRLWQDPKLDLYNK